MSKLIWRGGWNEVWLSNQEVVIKRKDVEPIVFQSEYFTEIAEQWLTEHAGYDVVKCVPEIAPCPLCGETKPSIVGVRYEGKYSGSWWVACHDCQFKSFNKPTKDEAIEAWNSLPRKELR